MNSEEVRDMVYQHLEEELQMYPVLKAHCKAEFDKLINTTGVKFNHPKVKVVLPDEPTHFGLNGWAVELELHYNYIVFKARRISGVNTLRSQLNKE